MQWKTFCDHCVIWRSLHWQHSSVTWRISLLILVRKHHAWASAAALPASLRFYALNFPRMRLAFWGFVWRHWIRLPAWFVFVLWFLFQIIGTLEQKAGMSSVSSAAHLGGAAVGVVAWLVWRKPNEKSRMLV